MTNQIKSGGEIARLAQLLCDQTLRRAPGNRDETIDLLDAALSLTPAKAGEDGVREAGQRVLHDKVHAEARAIHLKDMTQSGYDFWLIRVAAEHGARIALSSIEEPRGE